MEWCSEADRPGASYSSPVLKQQGTEQAPEWPWWLSTREGFKWMSQKGHNDACITFISDYLPGVWMQGLFAGFLLCV